MPYAIHLLHSTLGPVTFADATSVTNDGDGDLTVSRDDGELLAVFARGMWTHAVNTDPAEKREPTSGLGGLFARPGKT